MRFDKPSLKQALLPWIIAIAFFLDNLDASILNIAIPAMATSLHIYPLALKLAITSYLISLAIFIPLSGWLADRFGMRNIFAVSVALFALGSLFSGLANNLIFLVASRILQGVGGAMMTPVGRLIVLKLFPKEERLRITTFIMLPTLFSPAIAPIIGAFIVTYTSWRWIFFINLPICLLEFFLIFYLVENIKEVQIGKLGWINFILFSSSITAISFGFTALGQNAFHLSYELTLIIIGFTLLILYFAHQQFTSTPIFSSQLFKERYFTLITTADFIQRVCVGGIPFLISLLLQLGLHFSPIRAAS